MKKMLILIAMTVACFWSINAEARTRHSNPPKKVHTDLININVAGNDEITTLSAKQRVRLGHRRACDGVHGCICGTSQAHQLGLPVNYKGVSLALAKNWPRVFPHTSAQPGAVVVQDRGGIHGHVSRIVQNTGNCRAIVSDEKGQYERDICSRLVAYVSPGGSYPASQQYAARTRYASNGHGKRYRHQQYTQVASLNYTNNNNYGYDPAAVR